MNELITATLSSKAQITLPLRVRQLLGLGQAGQLVGFLMDPEAHMVKLTRVEAIPVDEEFTKAEYKKLAKLRKQKGKKSFRSMQALLRELKS